MFVILKQVLRASTIQLLRIHFSLFLLPVYLFALSQLNHIETRSALLSFVILHLLVYPSSNGYNSYMDRDETPIGGLSKPMMPTKQLYYVTIVLDIIAVVLGFFISYIFSLGILLYIVASRLYSYKGVRLKQYPVIGYLVVMIFQGALVFFISYHAGNPGNELSVPLLPCIISSCLIGALYPLTQIYQHEEDKRDGVVTISYVVGKRGTFILSMFLFILSAYLLYVLYSSDNINAFYLFLLITIPVVLFFVYWMRRVWVNVSEANYYNSLRMNILATLSTAIFFLILIMTK